MPPYCAWPFCPVSPTPAGSGRTRHPSCCQSISGLLCSACWDWSNGLKNATAVKKLRICANCAQIPRDVLDIACRQTCKFTSFRLKHVLSRRLSWVAVSRSEGCVSGVQAAYAELFEIGTNATRSQHIPV